MKFNLILTEDPIVIENGTLSWTAESITLKNINFRAKEGELVAVVGTIGIMFRTPYNAKIIFFLLIFFK